MPYLLYQYCRYTHRQIEILQHILWFSSQSPALVMALHGNKRKLSSPLNMQCIRYSTDRLYATFPAGDLGDWTVFEIQQPGEQKMHTPAAKPDICVAAGSAANTLTIPNICQTVVATFQASPNPSDSKANLVDRLYSGRPAHIGGNV